MPVTRDHELWALALHVEKKHGAGALDHIGKMLDKAAFAEDEAAINLWTAVLVRFTRLNPIDARL